MGNKAVDLRQLSALVMVADTRSVTRAAELLNIAQPAVTRQIKALERELGVILFERTRTGMHPTAAGDALLDRARRALAELDRARAELKPGDQGLNGIVSVGLLESTVDVVSERLVSTVRRAHPSIELRLVVGYSGYLQRWLDDGDLDLSLLYDVTKSPSLSTTPLGHDQLWVVARNETGLRPDVPTPVPALANQPLIMPAVGHGLRTLIDGAFARAEVVPKIAVETNSMQLQKSLVATGHGWTILPGAGVAVELTTAALSLSPLSAPAIRRTLVLGRRLLLRSAPAAEAVADVLATVVADSIRAGRWGSARSRND